MSVLSNWQVDRILEHQKLSRQRFGQIAVSWGWAGPQDIWQAWARQLAGGDRMVDLDEVGVDTAAVEKVPPAVAWHYRAVALRTWGDQLVLAVPNHLAEVARREMPTLLSGHLHFCIAHRHQMRPALERVYAMAVL